MEQELLKKIIVYSGGELGKTYPLTKIVDENGNKYTVFHNKGKGENQTVSKAFTQLGAMNLGQRVEIAYKEEDKTFVPTSGDNKGKEVSYKSRVVAFFSEAKEDVQPQGDIKEEFKFQNVPQPINTQETPQNQPQDNSEPVIDLNKPAPPDFLAPQGEEEIALPF